MTITESARAVRVLVKMVFAADLKMVVYACVSYQVVDLIGQVDLFVCVLQSFVIVLEHREGLGNDDSTVCMLLNNHLETFTHTFLMTSICSSLHSGLFFFALTKNSITFCSSWSVASDQHTQTSFI